MTSHLTLVVPIYEGYELSQAIQLSPRGGQSLTESFALALGMPSQSAAELSAARDIMMQEKPSQDLSHAEDGQQLIDKTRSTCIDTFLDDFRDENGWRSPSTGKSIGHFFENPSRCLMKTSVSTFAVTSCCPAV